MHQTSEIIPDFDPSNTPMVGQHYMYIYRIKEYTVGPKEHTHGHLDQAHGILIFLNHFWKFIILTYIIKCNDPMYIKFSLTVSLVVPACFSTNKIIVSVNKWLFPLQVLHCCTIAGKHSMVKLWKMVKNYLKLCKKPSLKWLDRIFLSPKYLETVC